MRKLYLTILALIALNQVFAGAIITAVINNGQWTNSSTWDLNRLPMDGDIIVIPAGMLIKLNAQEQLNNIVIKVKGTLSLENGKLHLNSASSVVVALGGQITGSGNNDQIKIGNVHKFKGSEPTQVGPSYANNTTGVSPNGFASGFLLPVKFISFYANQKNNNIELSWATAQEFDNSHFNIERSFDGRNWSIIGMVLGNGTTNSVSRYSYSDKNISNEVVYYRICQVDGNGRSEYTSVRIIRKSVAVDFTNIYASSKQTITIDFNKEVKNNVIVKVVNMKGQLIARQAFSNGSYRISLNINNAPAGLYVVQISDNNGWSETKKIAF